MRAYSSSALGPECRRAGGVVVVVPDEEAPVIACAETAATVDEKWDPRGSFRVRGVPICFHKLPAPALVDEPAEGWRTVDAPLYDFDDRPRFLDLQTACAEMGRPMGETDTERESNRALRAATPSQPRPPSRSGLQTASFSRAERSSFNIGDDEDEEEELYEEAPEEAQDV